MTELQGTDSVVAPQGSTPAAPVSNGQVPPLPSEDVSALKSAHERVKVERNQMREQLSTFKTELDQLKAQRESLGVDDPDELAMIIAQHREQQDKKMIESGEVEKLIAKREQEAVKRIKTTSDQTIFALTEERDNLRQSLHTTKVVSGIRAAAIKFGVLPDAEFDVNGRAERVFKVGADGEVHPHNPDGSHLIGQDGAEMGFDEWMGELRGSAKHLFRPNTGGGAASAVGGDASPGVSSGIGGSYHRNKMSVEQKVAFIEEQRAKGQTQQQAMDTFLALPE